MSTTEQLLETLENKDLCHFNLLFEERFSDCVKNIERQLITPLTDRERTVCYLVCLGKRMKEIAPLMSLSEHTVRSYSKQVHLKLAHVPQPRWLKTALGGR